MSEIFFAFSNIEEFRDEYFYLEDEILYQDKTCVIGCSPSRFAKDETTIVAMFGEVFNIDEFGYDVEQYTDAEIILKLLETEDPDDFFCQFTGSFTVLVYEHDLKEWMLITDAFGDYYPFYYIDNDEFIISMNLNDFNRSLFEFNAKGIDRIIGERDFKITETPVGEVYKLSEGSILEWPKQKKRQYIDINEELEYAYNNKISINVEEAVEYIDEILRKTVNITSRNYDKSRIGVEITRGIAGISVASTLKICGIDPHGYILVFPIQEQPSFPQVEDFAVSETKKRRQANKRLHDKLKLAQDYSTSICNYDDIDKHLTHDVVKNPLVVQWDSILFYNNEVGRMTQRDDISCLYNGNLGHIIFLNRLEYYIFYMLDHDGISKITDDEIREMFYDVIHDSTNYSFDNVKSFKKEVDMIGDGFSKYITTIMDISKMNLPDRDARLAWGVPRIGIYKNLKLWKFILSLPDNIMAKSGLDATLQKGVIEKQSGISNIRWSLYRWKILNHYGSSMFNRKKDKTPQSLVALIKHTEKTKNDWKEAITVLSDNGVDIAVLWGSMQHQKENPDILDSRSLKILLIYYWFKEWLK